MSVPSPHPASHSQPIVCVVDDDASVGRAIGRLLRVHGFDVHAYLSAEEFLASPHVDDSACVISDMRMPGMNGAALQRVLAERRPGLPMIFISAFRDEADAAKLAAAGATGFLTKPFECTALLNCLRAAIARTSAVGVGPARD